MPPRTPHLKAEFALWRDGKPLVVGVDEVGTGALCAPVVAAAVLVSDPDVAGLVSADLDVTQFTLDESYLITFFIEDIKLEVITNLPREEAIRVADELIPTQCLNPPTEEAP